MENKGITAKVNENIKKIHFANSFNQSSSWLSGYSLLFISLPWFLNADPVAYVFQLECHVIIIFSSSIGIYADFAMGFFCSPFWHIDAQCTPFHSNRMTNRLQVLSWNDNTVNLFRPFSFSFLYVSSFFCRSPSFESKAWQKLSLTRFLSTSLDCYEIPFLHFGIWFGVDTSGKEARKKLCASASY